MDEREQGQGQGETSHPGIVGGKGSGNVLGKEKIGDKYGRREDAKDNGGRGVVDSLLSILSEDRHGRDAI
jgi:hypothetical protein